MIKKHRVRIEGGVLRWLLRFPGADARETVSVPGFTSYPVMDEEQAGGVVFLLHRQEPLVVLAPIGLLPYAGSQSLAVCGQRAR